MDHKALDFPSHDFFNQLFSIAWILFVTNQIFSIAWILFTIFFSMHRNQSSKSPTGGLWVYNERVLKGCFTYEIKRTSIQRNHAGYKRRISFMLKRIIFCELIHLDNTKKNGTTRYVTYLTPKEEMLFDRNWLIC